MGPRVGGVLEVESGKFEIFTGGSNLVQNSVFTHTGQRRPHKFESVNSFTVSLAKGMDYKLAAADAKVITTLPNWFLHLGNELVRLGWDTVFRIPTVSWRDEVYIPTAWGSIKSEHLDAWHDQLTQGVQMPGRAPLEVCPFDLQNLDYSGTFILASLTKAYAAIVLEDLGPSPNGLMVLAYLIDTRLLKVVTRQRKLITALESMRLCDQEQENVRKFNVKLRDHCREIEQCGPPPRDLAVLVAATYVTSQVAFFAHKMLEIHLQLEENPQQYTWEQVMKIALAKWLTMESIWTPAGKTINSQGVSTKEFQSLKQSVNQLKINKQKTPQSSSSTSSGSPASSNNSNNSNGKKEQVCFDCGKKNAKKGHDGCPNPGEALFLPEKFKKKKDRQQQNSDAPPTSSNNWPASDEKKEDGKKWVLCRKCLNRSTREKGRWYPADAPNAHKTGAHKTVKELSGQNLASVDPHVVISQVSSDALTTNQAVDTRDPKLLAISQQFGIDYESLLATTKAVDTNGTNNEIQSAAPAPKIEELQPHGKLSFGIGSMNEIKADLHTHVSDDEDGDDSGDDGEGWVVNHWFQNCKLNTNHVSVETDDDEISHVCEESCEPEVTDLSQPNAQEEEDKVGPEHTLLKPWSNWYVINNYLWLNSLLHLTTILPLLLSWLSPTRKTDLGMSLLLLALSLGPHLIVKAKNSYYSGLDHLKRFLDKGPCTGSSFCYPAGFMILSCVMIQTSFANMYCLSEYLLITFSQICQTVGFKNMHKPLTQNRIFKKMQKKFNSFCSFTSPKVMQTKTSLKRSRLTRLCLLSALNQAHSIPTIHHGYDIDLRNKLKKHRNFMGHLNVKHVPDIGPVEDYLVNDLHNKTNLVDGAFTFIVDTGCACSCSPFEADFEYLNTLDQPITLKGVTGEQVCTQGGMLKVQCINSKGDIVTLRTPAYHNPHQTVRLFSPQAHFSVMSKKEGSMFLSWAKTYLVLPSVGKLPVYLDETTFMPLLTCFHDADDVVESLTHQCVTDEVNPMLSKGAKLMLKFHYKLGHLGFRHLIWLCKKFKLFGPLGILITDPSLDVPKCSSCITGGMEKKPIQGNVRTQDPARKGVLKREKLDPGDLIFSDQYVSSVVGKHFNVRGHLNTRLGFKGGTIFCDASSTYISLHHQQSFTAHETTESMISFEREAAEIGVAIKGYNTDNGVYTAKALISKLQQDKQTLRASGVGAHHQNGVAENAIKNVSKKARIYMFHAALRWPKMFDKTLWPLAMSHAVYLHNHIPKMHDGISPIEHWTRSISTHSELVNAHPFGVPAYVLNARLQDGFKIPRFDPRSMQGIYVGPSPMHASTVGLILNPRTNRISPQFHVIYDDYFETVPHDAENVPPNWEDLCLEGFQKSEMELDEDSVHPQDTFNAPEHAAPEQREPPDRSPTVVEVPRSAPPVEHHPTPQREDPPPQREAEPPDPVSQREVPPSPKRDSPAKDSPAKPPLRRSKRSRKPVIPFAFDKAHGYHVVKRFMKTLVLSCALLPCQGKQFNAHYAYALAIDPNSGIIHDTNVLQPDFMMRNPGMFKAGKKDADTPGIMEALSGPYRDEFMDAMQKEIEELESHGTWTVMRRSDIPAEKQEDGTMAKPKVLSGTWAFKIKRFPSGIMRKIKARFCARGDLQDDVDMFDTYAPVASWNSIRMLTITALQNNWSIQQVDFSNAFVHAPMKRNVYVSLPQMFKDLNGIPASELCLKLNKSLYGLKEAPKLWHDFLAQGLKDAGFKPSDSDPGVFYGRGMALAVYVDDVLFFGPDEKEMKKVVSDLKLQGFELKVEKDAKTMSFDFLGIHID